MQKKIRENREEEIEKRRKKEIVEIVCRREKKVGRKRAKSEEKGENGM